MEIILLALLFANVVLQAASSSCEVNRELESTCGSYCFRAIQPILDQTRAMQMKIDECEKKSDSALKVDNTEHLTQQRFDEYEKQINDLREKIAELKEHLMKPFEKIGSKYYYIEHNNELSWFEAGDKCRQLGGHLASLQNEDELKAISQKLSKKRYWLDINDLEQEGVFKSSTSGKNQAFFSWYYPGEPNNMLDQEDCVELYKLDAFYGMNDDVCSSRTGFICEKDF